MKDLKCILVNTFIHAVEQFPMQRYNTSKDTVIIPFMYGNETSTVGDDF